MNNLVAYDSSSDDDSSAAAAIEIKSVARANESTTATHPSKAQLGKDTVINKELLIGPSTAPDGAEDYEDYDEDTGFDPSMSERDIIRYLTQASHPMTEMPSSPPQSPDAATSARFRRFLDLKAKGIHFNEDLASKSGFNNPSLLFNLMQKAGIDGQPEYMTSLPSEVFDSNSLPVYGYKEALLKSQQTIRAQDDAEKKTLAAAGKRTMEFSSAGHSELPGGSSSSSGVHRHQKQ